MQTFKYKTRISKTGQIKLSLNNELFDKEVEITIVPQRKKNASKQSISDFINEWSGFLSDANTSDAKYHYLSDKYK